LTTRRIQLLVCLALACFVGAALSCGGGNPSSATTTPTSVPPTTIATPEPTPSPTPAFGTACNLGFVDENVVEDCSPGQPSFIQQVNEAIDRLVAESPDIFDKSEQRGGGGYRILSLGRYYVGVIANLEDMGFCAVFDGEEVAVKTTNDFNDQYDIELSSSHIRRGSGQYMSTCRPAVFPKPVGHPPQTPGCSLPPSREMACGRENPHHLDAVDSVIEQLYQDRPELFDFRDINPGTDFPKVLDEPAFVQAVVDGLIAKGLCALWDGEEIQVKGGNEFSDHIDILLWTGYVFRGLGSYMSSCYPAAF